MQTQRLTDDPQGIATAARLLAAGWPVAIPTETVYGLAADARNGAAVAAVYAAKGRPAFNPLILHVADLTAARALVDLPDEAEALAAAFWPGALTLVAPLRAEAGVASLVTAGLTTAAVRVPTHPVAQAVLRAFGGPLAAPSANASGRVSPTTADHVLDSRAGLGGRIAAVLDGGPCPVGVESTIIGWDGAQPVLMRPGGIATEAIEAVLAAPLRRGPDPDSPRAPGQLASHYAPQAAVRLNADAPRAGEQYIGFGSDGPLSLSPTGDLTEAAARLFDVLRRADDLGQPIAVAPVPDHGLGAAINDRLRRAAAPR
ncbi:MAG: L-threonylcarbamoyladenylate synthase [Paracoccus sp. (in: a-proteobacteria)]|uniref:L-threonylcarbamoyladenylate synthase n=1 Tax=Paracoccus sp. TaxID=267 RepID=UPI0026DFAD9D|nr:L-threonylcarbamoyladenylate synthase [Paracoccus sp. (in: a-proteobacteria)]MDO5632483.1 L-threonylcarbamoyladenylate synthase [Paracoccus sp. (in: a-proteobacteria)]